MLTRPKTGFELPLGHWLRSVLRDRFLSATSGAAARPLFQSDFLADCRRRIDETDAASLLWTLLVLLAWIERYGIDLPSDVRQSPVRDSAPPAAR